MVKRIYVERIDAHDFASKALAEDLKATLGLKFVKVKKLVRYDIEGLSEQIFNKVKQYLFADAYDEVLIDGEAKFQEYSKGKKVLQIQLLDGQYDLRADGIANCIQIYSEEKLNIKSADVYVFDGISADDFKAATNYLFNPVDSELVSKEELKTLVRNEHDMGKARIEIKGFIDFDDARLNQYFKEEGFAMTISDLKFVQDYFKSIKRNPTVTELKVIDTYWSDHCRHTTFFTELIDISIDSKNPEIKASFERYINLHKDLFKGRNDKYVCLMDLATIAARYLRKAGILTGQEVSEEINACSVRATIDNDGVNEDWLIMFKNETHNHPTEMEPYGGAGTCLGGAIRDPLSGRAFVYQAMRLTAAGNILEDIKKTMPNKLPQRTLSRTAMRGYSSYGNQIGIASGQLNELFYDRYKAKRMEAGYVIGAVKEEYVTREVPQKGDLILLVGGETGRDGIGGATGSSRSQTVESFDEAGAEVQKGNAAEERKLIRLYNNPEASKMIIRSNDFGAGGVSVAIGELADGLDVYLERVPVKYPLTATEIAISESQERMAVVIKPKNLERFVELAQNENLKITHVATVTDLDKMRLFFKEDLVVDLDRSFLNTNGAKQIQKAKIKAGETKFFAKADGKTLDLAKKSLKDAAIYELSKMNNCSQKGIANNFDSTVLGLTVLAPYGGKNQITPTTLMASKPPVSGFTKTVTCSSYGIYPDLMMESVYVGAIHSVVSSISKLIASGVSYKSIYMSYQEFFKRLGHDAERWGEPLEALLGAFKAQMDLGLGSIGGKDSMSGTYENVDVPPTLISFAMGTTNEDYLLHSAFPLEGKVYLAKIKRDSHGNVDFEYLVSLYKEVEQLIKDGMLKASAVVENNLFTTLATSLMGNDAGIKFEKNIAIETLFNNMIGDMIFVAKSDINESKFEYIGSLNSTAIIEYGNEKIDLASLKEAYKSTLESLYPTNAKLDSKVKNITSSKSFNIRKSAKVKPTVLVPVLLGSVGEMELVKAFEREGAKVEQLVFKNITKKDINASIKKLEKAIMNAQIFAFSDTLTCGDELDGTNKFASTLLSLDGIRDSLKYLMQKNDGLILGLGGAFEALLENGFITDKKNISLSQNAIAKYVSAISKVRVASNFSPWMSSFEVGEQFNLAISTGKGRVVAEENVLEELVKNGQVATQFADYNGNASMLTAYNPTGSELAIESLVSEDGKVLGKLGHVERYQKGLYQNIPGSFDMNIFKSGIKYFD